MYPLIKVLPIDVSGEAIDLETLTLNTCVEFFKDPNSTFVAPRTRSDLKPANTPTLTNIHYDGKYWNSITIWETLISVVCIIHFVREPLFKDIP